MVLQPKGCGRVGHRRTQPETGPRSRTPQVLPGPSPFSCPDTAGPAEPAVFGTAAAASHPRDSRRDRQRSSPAGERNPGGASPATRAAPATPRRRPAARTRPAPPPDSTNPDGHRCPTPRTRPAPLPDSANPDGHRGRTARTQTGTAAGQREPGRPPPPDSTDPTCNDRDHPAGTTPAPRRKTRPGPTGDRAFVIWPGAARDRGPSRRQPETTGTCSETQTETETESGRILLRYAALRNGPGIRIALRLTSHLRAVRPARCNKTRRRSCLSAPAAALASERTTAARLARGSLPVEAGCVPTHHGRTPFAKRQRQKRCRSTKLRHPFRSEPGPHPGAGPGGRLTGPSPSASRPTTWTSRRKGPRPGAAGRPSWSPPRRLRVRSSGRTTGRCRRSG